jgi:hypothetical protein
MHPSPACRRGHLRRRQESCHDVDPSASGRLARFFGKGRAAALPRTIRRLRASFRKIHAAIAAARLHHLREEVTERSVSGSADPKRQAHVPPVLGDK